MTASEMFEKIAVADSTTNITPELGNEVDGVGIHCRIGDTELHGTGAGGVASAPRSRCAAVATDAEAGAP